MLRSAAGGLGRTGTILALAVFLAVFSVGTASAGAATSPWSQVNPPWPASSPLNDVYPFGATGLAVAGDGNVGITRDGGRSWSVVVPGGLNAAGFTAIAFDTSGRGIVASGGLLLVTDDWGKTWRTPAYVGPGLGAACNDIALSGARAFAVGDDGEILTSSDGGATWTRQASPTLSSLTSVAVAGDGTAVAGSVAGEMLVGTSGIWALAGTAVAPITSVAAASNPVWGDGQPDLFAATGSDILASDDALTFASVPGLPTLSSQPWPGLAWLDVPQHSLLLAGAGNAGIFEPLSRLWLPSLTGLGSTARAVAPADQSVAYLLGTDGRLVRTLSAGREPATIRATPSTIKIGSGASLLATVSVGAPGTVRMLQRVPGQAWQTIHAASWTAGDWNRSLSFGVRPSLTHDYLLQFQYGGTTTDLTSPFTIVVDPKITTTRSRFALHVGDVFRFSGSVTPALPGERVDLFTDRGGTWRRVSRQGYATLRGGRTWTSRRFGTPKAETYHMRAHLGATSIHGEAWGPKITVTIR
jgi:photosystem II stability/assembly factor-like uncharacterized protein